jgi:twitching motility protein PilT
LCGLRPRDRPTPKPGWRAGWPLLKRRERRADALVAAMELNSLLRRAVELGASDIHLKVGVPPILRRDGGLAPLEECPVVTDRDTEGVADLIGKRAPERLEAFKTSGDLDVAYQEPGLPRFRVNAFRQRGHISVAFRVIPKNIPNFEMLHLPQGIRRLAEEHRGLVLVTGATGSGKTTTLAAIIDHINRSRHQHIVTIEDPIEILHSDHSCIVNQREIGLDTADFTQALRRALRQDPDVILIGELRDAETAQTALQAAESGHLVFSTLHTVDAAETIGRMVEFFPEGKQQMIRSVMAGVLRGVISQRLLPRADGGRIAAVEVMVTNTRIADLIRENKPEAITDAIEEGSFFDMQTFTKALIDLVVAGQVDQEVAANAATNRHDFLVTLERAMKQKKADVAADEKQKQEEEKRETEPEVPTLRLAQAGD